MLETIMGNFNLTRILSVIKKKLVFIILATVIGGVLAGGYALKTGSEVYRAVASMYVYSDPSYRYENNINVTYNEFLAAKNLVQSYMLVLSSNTVLEKVIEQLGIQDRYTPEILNGMLSSYSVKDTAIFYIYVDSKDPYAAMEIVNAIADIAPDEISRVVKSGGVEVIDHAGLPMAPYSNTNIIKYLLLGMGGLGGGTLLIFLFFGLLDTTLRNKEEFLSAFKLPYLGSIPIIGDSIKKNKKSKMLSIDSPFAIKESYNKIRTNLLFTAKGEKCPVFTVVSCSQEDGKTLNTINLAISYAMLGKKTLLIDSDLRKPGIYSQFGYEENQSGLSQYLSGITDSVSVRGTDIDNLSVLLAGMVPPNPAELIASERFERLLYVMRDEFDYIFIDTSPLGVVTDSLQIANCITGYILVVRNNYDRLKEERVMMDQFNRVDTNICGFIYNGIQMKQNYYYHKRDKGYVQKNSKEEKLKKAI